MVKKGNIFEMDFPARKPQPITMLPIMEQAIKCNIVEALGSRDLLLLLENERQVRELCPDFE